MHNIFSVGFVTGAVREREREREKENEPCSTYNLKKNQIRHCCDCGSYAAGRQIMCSMRQAVYRSSRSQYSSCRRNYVYTKLPFIIHSVFNPYVPTRTHYINFQTIHYFCILRANHGIQKGVNNQQDPRVLTIDYKCLKSKLYTLDSDYRIN